LVSFSLALEDGLLGDEFGEDASDSFELQFSVVPHISMAVV
jgi:hypothetical protein